MSLYIYVLLLVIFVNNFLQVGVYAIRSVYLSFVLSVSVCLSVCPNLSVLDLNVLTDSEQTALLGKLFKVLTTVLVQ